MIKPKNVMSMIALSKGELMNIEIEPRWPQKQVFLNEDILNLIFETQNRISNNVRLVITRGYQKEGIYLKYLRKLGSMVFKLIYNARQNEIEEIFTCNGHSVNGSHLDISISYKGKKINFLPVGVFTPLWMANKNRLKYMCVLQEVRNALLDVGFTIHTNPIEELQIHCDYNYTHLPG